MNLLLQDENMGAYGFNHENDDRDRSCLLACRSTTDYESLASITSYHSILLVVSTPPLYHSAVSLVISFEEFFLVEHQKARICVFSVCNFFKLIYCNNTLFHIVHGIRQVRKEHYDLSNYDTSSFTLLAFTLQLKMMQYM